MKTAKANQQRASDQDVARALMCGVSTFDDLVAVFGESAELLADACFGDARTRRQAQQVLMHMIDEARGPDSEVRMCQ